jgi:peptidoglycan/LPS O-acetylase OafA/YrhL
MRDALFGVFGTRKSNLTAAAMAALMSLAIAATFAAFATLTTGRLTDPAQLAAIALASIGTPMFALFIIRTDGPQEVRDTLWACLDLDDSSGGTAAPAEPAN